jgi:glycerol transport system ATP-binding protein
VQIGTPAELFERPRHTFVGYFIGSPGMNVLPATLDGTTVTVGEMTVDLPYPVAVDKAASLELGIRPEYVRLGRAGTPVAISKVEDIGRQKIVRASLSGREIAAIVSEDGEIPAEPRIAFDPKGINIYANSWRVEGEPRP